ncbi:MAG: N-acetylmuramoyl-L-alanine amidase [Magnetococcales bacterium]|nr:N-acetylmuramoyl-L-alanine amidase [Magnetococcales bacterium]
MNGVIVVRVSRWIPWLRLGLMSALLLVSLSGGNVQAGNSLVAIDVGHTAQRPGAISARGEPEYQFNTALAQVVRRQLEAGGVPTLLLQEEAGQGMTLPARASLAAARQAGLLLSIHHDSVQPHYLRSWQWQGSEQHYADRFSGFSLFVSRLNRQLATSLHCASRIGEALRAAGLQPTSHHAEAIAGENRPWADAANGVYYFDDLLLLKSAQMPAVLLEAGVIVHRQEELLLRDAERQKQVAEAVLHGVQRCLE